MKSWKTLSPKTVLSWNEFLTVESHDIQLPDIRELENALDAQRINALAWSTIVLLALRELQRRNAAPTQVTS